jgi:hypothetical protein
MSQKVYVIQTDTNSYRVDPPTIRVTGGHEFHLVNATTQGLVVRLPKGSASADADIEHAVARGKKQSIDTIPQPNNETRAYRYRVKMDSGEEAEGNSDPILIIEH